MNYLVAIPIIYIILSALVLSDKSCPSDMVRANDKLCIDKYEWPNKKGAKPLVGASGLPEHKNSKEIWDAKTLCESVGKRVCEADEWITSCLGPNKSKYPWGNNKPKNIYTAAQPCNFDKIWKIPNERLVLIRDPYEMNRLNQSELSGHRKACISASGAFDMVGNAEEWVIHPKDSKRMCLAGGHWTSLKSCDDLICVHWARWHYYTTGFRCCKTLE